MTQTKIDPLWGQPCQAIQLQALPSQEGLDALVSLQDRIEETLDCELLRIPTQSLHCTILTLLPPAKIFDKPKFELWAEHSDVWTAALGEILSKAEPFALQFAQIDASEMAIIVKAPVPPVLDELRRVMADAIECQGWHPRPPDIAHITIFRYRQSCALPQPQDHDWTVNLTMQVERLRLIKETVYPTLEHEPLDWFPLSAVDA